MWLIWQNIPSTLRTSNNGRPVCARVTECCSPARSTPPATRLTLLDSGSPLPYDLDGAVIYYAGPTPTPPHLAIGSCGPTTSGRMDPFAPRMLDLGLGAMVGKGGRSPEVCEAIRRNRSVYLCAVGGAGALASQCITSCEVIAFEDLGCESVKRLTFDKFPLIVAIDCEGGTLFA